jgi:DNA-binding PadR family transcriptional regulator
MFGKGDLKYVFLDLLQERPRHGYDLIRALEERFAGSYTASPGTVYPVLQLLEDMGHVSVVEQDGRKVYTVTPQGEAFLAERQDTVREIWEKARWQCGALGGEAWIEMMAELRELAALFGKGRGAGLDADQLRRIRDVVANARREIEAILAR